MIVDGARILEEIPEEAWTVTVIDPGDEEIGNPDVHRRASMDPQDRTRLVHLIAGMADEALERHLAGMAGPPGGQPIETADTETIWEEISRLRQILQDRSALCGNCGTPITPDRIHSANGLGSCTLTVPAGWVPPVTPRYDLPGGPTTAQDVVADPDTP